MERHIIFDKILGLLDQNYSVGEARFVRELGFTIDEVKVALDSLESKVVIEHYSSGGQDGYEYRITQDGKDLIADGGFTKRYDDQQSVKERNELEFNWKRRDEKRKNTNIIFVVVMAIFALWNISLQLVNRNANWETKENTKVQMDSIKAIVSLSQMRIDSLSKIINDRSTKKDTDIHNKNMNTPTDNSIKQK